MGQKPQRVSDVMTTEIATLEAGDHLDLASDIMTLGRIRHMPVTRDGKLVGILSQRDLFRGAVSSALQFRPSAEREWLAKIRVSEVMTTDVVTAEPDWPVRHAVEVMLEGRFGCLPVVDEQDRLVGLLSETDCLRLLATYLAEGS